MTTYEEDEIDFYPYVLTLYRHWKLIFLVGVLCGAAALVFSLMKPRTYSATATMVVTYRQPVLTLSEEFSMVTSNIDLRNKQSALLAIAQSDQVAYSTYEILADQLPSEMTLEDFQKDIEVVNDGDAILVTASFESPTLSAEVSNTWASQAIQTINSAYGDVQPLDAVQIQLVEAERSYNEAQKSLEMFIEENQASDLERQIIESQAILDILQNARLQIVQQQLNTQISLLTGQANQYFQALETNNQALFSEQVQAQLALLSYYTNRKTELDALITQMRALKAQVSEGTASSAGNRGDALAVLLARAQTFGIEYPANAQFYGKLSGQTETEFIAAQKSPLLQLNLTDLAALQDSSANYTADLDTLISQIEMERTKTEAEIQRLSESLAAGANYQYYDLPDAENPLYQAGLDRLKQIANLELTSALKNTLNGTLLEQQIEQVSTEIQALQAQLEQEQAKQRQLTSERDLAEKAYQALLVKETEIKTGAQTSNEVVLASIAVPPVKPDSRGTIANTLLGGIVGGMLAVSWVLASDWWQSRSGEISGAHATDE